ncbi:MAG: hypothetical protein R3B47_06445 [Bacteroidia bacterium]
MRISSVLPTAGSIFIAPFRPFCSKSEHIRNFESYILETFTSFEKDKVFDRNSHLLRLQMRTWRINSLRKLLRLKEEAEEIKLLWKDLKAFSRQNFNEYAVYYYNATINNLKNCVACSMNRPRQSRKPLTPRL